MRAGGCAHLSVCAYVCELSNWLCLGGISLDTGRDKKKKGKQKRGKKKRNGKRNKAVSISCSCLGLSSSFL